VVDLLEMVVVDAGDRHSCSMDSDGALWCWGGNMYGQLGDGTTQTTSTPVPVTAWP
jgi:alpha-tubulin suppressor-like RCC1 family protein